MNISEFLEREEDARKVFGEKEMEIVRKQVNGIDLTQSEKNRLSRDIRPKLRFAQKISSFEENDLKKNSANKEIIEEAKEEILRDELGKEVSSILLFGSQAKGTQTWRSDIDLCVVFDRDIGPKEVTKFRKRIMGKVHDKVDIQVFEALPSKVRKEVAKNHKVIYSKNSFDNVEFTRSEILKASDIERLAKT